MVLGSNILEKRIVGMMVARIAITLLPSFAAAALSRCV